MVTARENMDKVINNTVQLEENQIKLINGYSHVLQCMNKKLAESHFDLIHSAGRLALVQSLQGNDADVNPIYLEMRATLLSREIYYNCANEAIESLNKIFEQNTNSAQSNQNGQQNINNELQTQSKNTQSTVMNNNTANTQNNNQNQDKISSLRAPIQSDARQQDINLTRPNKDEIKKQSLNQPIAKMPTHKSQDLKKGIEFKSPSTNSTFSFE